MSNNSAGTLPTGSGHLLAERAGGVLTLTLNRPRARNAFSREMLEALAAMLDLAALAARLAALSPDAVRAMRGHVDRARTHDFAACADAEAEWHVRLLASDAHRDAVRALPHGGAVRTSPTTENPGAKES